ncbi:sialin-like [Macrosteles quadrilineatus]|uniref:sialin-like n=1 Tax=Macrosteles quadrilineatus TaxID=74068 RepID=UPI0023E3195D|nr:sialin-like [Macrosteles quadrilineatus]
MPIWLRSSLSLVPQRWVVCALCSLAFAIISYKNTCYNAISNVVDSFTQESLPPPEEYTCPFKYLDNHSWKRTLPFYLPDIYWNPWVLVVAHSAFQTGKLLFMVPAGVLSDIGYSKYVLGGGMTLLTFKYLLHPTMVNYGITIFAVVNFLEGVGEATIYPSTISLISCWTSPYERNVFVAVVVAGTYYGKALGHAFFHLIYVGSSSWSVGEYATGVVGLVWLVLCAIFIHRSPKDSPFISRHEIRRLTITQKSSIVSRLHKLHGIPWRKIVTSPPFLSLVLAFSSVDWATTLNVMANFGDYQMVVLNLPESFSKGSTVTMVAILPSLLMSGFLTDYIIKHDLMSKTVVKRTFTFVGVFVSSLLLVAACCLAGCDVMMFWLLSIAGVYVIGLAVPVVYSAAIDLSPRHAGLLMGMMYSVRTIFSLFNYRIDQILIDDEFDVVQWRVRSVVVAIFTVALIFPFLFFGSSEMQIWTRQSHVALQLNPVEMDSVTNEPTDQQATTSN